MSLNFPNQSRSYDGTHRLIRFWGYDRALEIPFFLDESAVYKLVPDTRPDETGFLETFDARIDRIHQVATKVYARHGNGSYMLAASDF